MQYLTYFLLAFSVLAALDRVFGSPLGLGKDFEKAFMLMGSMSLSMIGMIVISPLLAELMQPVSVFLTETLDIDASIIPASLFANDMGGAALSVEMASDSKIGLFNGLVVSSMMGCTVSYTIPFSLGVVNKQNHRELMLGLLCGIVTVPIGCFAGGLLCGLEVSVLIRNLIPLAIFSGLIALGLILMPSFCIKLFRGFGYFITGVITVGLSLGIIRFLTGYEVVKGLTPLEDGAAICLNAAVVLSGSFPLMGAIAKVLQKPLRRIGAKMGMNEYGVVGLVSSIASSSATFGMTDKMDKKGIVLNSAYAVSGAFVVGSHLAFTMAFDSTYILPVIAGKILAGVLAVFLACLVFKRVNK